MVRNNIFGDHSFNPVDVYILMLHNSVMRYALLSLAIIPALISPGTTIMCYGKNEVDAEQEKCLAVMIYGEARGESEKGMAAVAHTAVNRATKKSLCQVVLAPKQYSIFNNNPALRAAAMSLHVEPVQKNKIDEKSWEKSVEVANQVLHGKIPDPTYGSTHYVAYKSLKRVPHWTLVYSKTTKIGNHTFFKKLVAQNSRLDNYPKKFDS